MQKYSKSGISQEHQMQRSPAKHTYSASNGDSDAFQTQTHCECSAELMRWTHPEFHYTDMETQGLWQTG